MTAKNLRPTPGAMPGVTSMGNNMGPVLKDITRVFNDYKAFKFDKKENHLIGLSEVLSNKLCERSPFGIGYHWMYYYLFPEIIPFHKYIGYPCDFFDEETILRIMAEHGLL